MPDHHTEGKDYSKILRPEVSKVNPQLGHVASHYAKDAIFVSNDMPFPLLRFTGSIKEIYIPGRNNLLPSKNIYPSLVGNILSE